MTKIPIISNETAKITMYKLGFVNSAIELIKWQLDNGLINQHDSLRSIEKMHDLANKAFYSTE
jgi:hypothetical protein